MLFFHAFRRSVHVQAFQFFSHLEMLLTDLFSIVLSYYRERYGMEQTFGQDMWRDYKTKSLVVSCSRCCGGRSRPDSLESRVAVHCSESLNLRKCLIAHCVHNRIRQPLLRPLLYIRQQAFRILLISSFFATKRA